VRESGTMEDGQQMVAPAYAVGVDYVAIEVGTAAVGLVPAVAAVADPDDDDVDVAEVALVVVATVAGDEGAIRENMLACLHYGGPRY